MTTATRPTSQKLQQRKAVKLADKPFTRDEVETMVGGLNNRLTAFARRFELQQIDEIRSRQIEMLAAAVDSLGARLANIEDAITAARKRRTKE